MVYLVGFYYKNSFELYSPQKMDILTVVYSKQDNKYFIRLSDEHYFQRLSTRGWVLGVRYLSLRIRSKRHNQGIFI